MYATDTLYFGSWSLKANATPSAIMTTAEAKLVARISISDDDAFVAALVTAATQYAERIQNRQLMSLSFTLKVDCFPCGQIDLPRPPLRGAVGSITYVAPDGTSTLLDSGDYQVDANSEPARIVPAYGMSWPATRPIPDAVTIAYTAGYDTAASVPAATVQAIALKVRQLYDGEELEGSPLDQTIDRLLTLNAAPWVW
jgi:uncharacterized phiE125 gp8 family phage protein